MSSVNIPSPFSKMIRPFASGAYKLDYLAELGNSVQTTKYLGLLASFLKHRCIAHPALMLQVALFPGTCKRGQLQPPSALCSLQELRAGLGGQSLKGSLTMRLRAGSTPDPEENKAAPSGAPAAVPAPQAFTQIVTTREGFNNRTAQSTRALKKKRVLVPPPGGAGRRFLYPRPRARENSGREHVREESPAARSLSVNSCHWDYALHLRALLARWAPRPQVSPSSPGTINKTNVCGGGNPWTLVASARRSRSRPLAHRQTPGRRSPSRAGAPS